MRTRIIVGAAAAVVVIATAGFFAASAEHERGAAEDAQARAEIERLAAERDRLQRDLRARRLREQQELAAREAARRDAAEAERGAEGEDAPARGEEAGEDAAPEEAWRGRVAEYPAFEVEGVDGGLRDVDWVAIGENMAALPALVRSVVDHVNEGGSAETVSPDTIGLIQQRSAPILTAAMKLSQAGMPGTGVNGAITHPTVMSNAIAASLEALALPLSRDQAVRMEELTVRFTRRDQERLAALDGSETMVARLLGESDVRRDYFRAVYAVLSPEQNEALRPEPTRGRLRLDLFCESLLWIGRVAPLFVADRAELQERIAPWIISRAALPPEVHEAAREIVADWAAGVPQEVLDREPSLFAKRGNLHVDEVTASARQTALLLDRLLAELDLDEAAAERVRAVPGSLVTYRSGEGT